MPEINATDAKRIAGGFAPRVADPLLLAPFNIGMAMYRHWLGVASRLLEDQCAHLQNLADCEDPLNMLVCQTEFAEKSLAASLHELRQGVDTIADTAWGHSSVGGALLQ